MRLLIRLFFLGFADCLLGAVLREFYILVSVKYSIKKGQLLAQTSEVICQGVF